MSNNLVRGASLLTGAALLSKILGMIYVIPFNALVGAQGGALYLYAYNPYTILVGISTVGIPLAVSKFVSKYNSLGDYHTGMRMFRVGLVIMSLTGIVAFLILYFSSGWIAGKYIVDDEHGNTVEDVKMVIQMVSFALLIIPAMSIFRGFFQGNQSMGPTAVSQVVEQIVRIVFVLVAGYLVIFVFNGTTSTAVGYATFAAFIGALASFVVLITYWQKRKHHIHKQIEQQKKSYDISTKEMIIELFRYAGPFVLVGIAIPLYQNVDSFTFNKAMVSIGQGDLSDTAFSAINLYGHKLIIIPVTIATGLSLAIIPELTKAFTQNNRKVLFKQINQSLQIVLVLVIPAVVGLASLSYVAYGSLYGMNESLEVSSTLLAWYAPVALLFALFTVTAAILQGVNEQRYAVFSLLVGFMIKLLFNTLLIQTFGAKGAIFGTGFAVTAAVSLNLLRIHRSILFSFKQTFKRSILMAILAFVMWIVLYITKYVFGLIIPYEESRLAAIFMLFIGISIGGFVYLLLAYKTTMIEHIFGPINLKSRVGSILGRFRRRR